MGIEVPPFADYAGLVRKAWNEIVTPSLCGFAAAVRSPLFTTPHKTTRGFDLVTVRQADRPLDAGRQLAEREKFVDVL